MGAESYLNQIRKLDQLIDAKIAERDRLYAIATGVSAKAMDGMPHSSAGMVSQSMENAIINLMVLEEELDKLIDTYVDCKQEIVKVLEKLPEKEYGVLHRYYIRYMTLEDIATNMGYCERQISRIKRNGLKILEDVIVCHAKK